MVESIFPKESIELAVSFGEEPKISIIMSNLMVVKGISSYNAIIGRPTLVAMKEVTSTYHLCLKFPTLCSITFVRENQYEARMCYTTSIRSAPADSKRKQTIGKVGLREEAFTIGVFEIWYELGARLPAQQRLTGPVEETEEVGVDNQDPACKIKIRTFLSPKIREAIMACLRRNQDVFT